ncbi:hypothetical protein [Bradyrhizobium glycinis]|uniref:hypothetical protein n=1 Tax=Bradyrhizobium glycinis TaxID=2751812 RepID=UPI0018D8123C|nr:hypothetical protein [Bradyrhizobium glycinis]MBH5368098.1 hypothetical protein [Bradyrhizobium glycinis]
MRWKISPHFKPGPHLDHKAHDPRTIDLLAIIALLALVLGSGWYLARSLATQPSTTTFIVPSQSVHW